MRNRRMMRMLVILAVLAVVGLGRLISGGTPDTAGQTLADARRDLTGAGVSAQNIEVVGEQEDLQGNPGTLVVCEQRPVGVDSEKPVTLRVSPDCPQIEDDDRDRRRGGFRFGGGRRF